MGTPSPAHDVASSLKLIASADALLLDYNGTLSDDEDILADLVRDLAAQELGASISRERYFTEFAGFTEDHMFGIIASEQGRTIDLKRMLHLFNHLYLERTHANSTISRSAGEFVRLAHRLGKRLMVVTAASQDIVLPTLERTSLSQYIEGVVALEQVTFAKPDPEGYLRALQILGVEATQAVAFEDSRTGIRAAHGAGLTAIGVIGSLPLNELRELTTHTVAELHPSLLDRLDT